MNLIIQMWVNLIKDYKKIKQIFVHISCKGAHPQSEVACICTLSAFSYVAELSFATLGLLLPELIQP